MKLRLAIIGMGAAARHHLAAVRENAEDIELVAVCDIAPERMSDALGAAGSGGQVMQYTNYRQLLREARPDLAVVATASWLHGQIGLDCLNAGCGALLEKPMALSLREIDEMTRISAERGLLLATCHQYRYSPAVRLAKEALDGGRFGRLSHIAAQVRWSRNREYYEASDWRGSWAKDGGCLMNQCIHVLDLLCWLLGDIEEVFACTARRQHDYIQGEDLGLALIRAKSGALASFEGTVNVYPRSLEEGLAIFGETGTVKLAGNAVSCVEHWEFADGLDSPDDLRGAVSEAPGAGASGCGKLYADIVDAVRTGRSPLTGGAEGRRAAELVLAIYKSQKTGLPVKLPLEDFSLSEMEGIFDEAD